MPVTRSDPDVAPALREHGDISLFKAVIAYSIDLAIRPQCQGMGTASIDHHE
ncbi:hypothetical protein GCM10010401_08010 [Rarobacter faecitabidus]